MAFTYEEFKALILIYTANASEGLSPEEVEFVIGKVGKDHYDKAYDFFDTRSEIEIIEQIELLAEKYASNNKEKIYTDIKELIQVDDEDKATEEQILRMLKKML